MPIQTELLATIRRCLSPDDRPADPGQAELVWRTMFDCLAPLIGPLSAGLLFERSLILNTRDFPWLEAAGAAASGAHVIDAFVRTLEGRSAADIEAANHALLGTYTDELAGLIGASLASRLLQVAFAPAPRVNT